MSRTTETTIILDKTSKEDIDSESLKQIAISLAQIVDILKRMEKK